MAALLSEKHWSWFEQEVNRHYLKFTEKRNVNIFIGTWNVNAKEPKDEITSWLIDPDNKFNADIYVLGFQEIVDLNAANLWIENTANEGWEQQIEETLKANLPNHQYVKVESRTMVGILLCVYVKSTLRPSVRNVMTEKVGVGVFGTAGNKGGVGIRMQVYDSDICFICSHLAAHKKNVAGRNQDYLKIIENMKFSPSGKQRNESKNNDETQQPIDHNEHEENNEDEELLSVISHHDMVFWLGDLNYRYAHSTNIQKKLKKLVCDRLNFDNLDEVFATIKQRDWNYLLAADQLNVERSKQRAFGGFVESEIAFDPTYKYQPGTSVYEQRPDKKKRMPAWCDRILWRRGTKKTTDIKDVKCFKYWSCRNQTMSDHKPVYAYLQYRANVFDQTKKAKMRKQIMKNKDKNDNNQLPQIEIEPEVSFPLIKFGEAEHKKFIIHNTGQVPVSFRFTHAEHKKSLPKWLKISPQRGLVRPQQKGTILFEISVLSDVVKTISAQQNKMEETVLLRIENTSDKVVPMKFVIVTAKYLTSCFGNKIENLVKYRKPIRYIEDINDVDIDSKHIAKQINKYDHGVDIDDDDGYNTSIEQTLSIPKELWRLIDHLYKYGMDVENIFISRGITTEISEIRECLDTGKAFTRYEMHSVGEALVRFLESLQDPVFPASLCQSLKDKDMDYTHWCRQALMRLPLSHYNTFIYVVSFLREVLKHSSRNRLDPEKLAYQFSSALMQTSLKDVSNLSSFKPFKILRHFLSSDLFL